MIFGDGEKDQLRTKNKQLNNDLRALQRKHTVLVKQVEMGKKISEQPISTVIEVPLDAKSDLIVVAKSSMIPMPTGGRAFLISRASHAGWGRIPRARFLFDTLGSDTYRESGASCVDDIRCNLYLSTNGSFVYTFNGELLAEHKEHEYAKLFTPLQQAFRKTDRAVLKVTFPEVRSREETRIWLGLDARVDPIVEVVFE